MPNPVIDFYNQNPENEWNRLFVSPYRRLEYEVILHFLGQYLPPQGHILDLGGGPGRYTIALARQGYTVTLVDVAEANIRLARQKIERQGLKAQVAQMRVADARELSFLQNESFDAVLCMGPLYHLPQKQDRLQCLHECHRVLKPDSPLFLTLLPRGSYLRDALRSGNFYNSIHESPQVFEQIFRQGHSPEAQVPNMYFCSLDEIPATLADTGFELDILASTHGFASFMDEQVNALAKNPEAWNALLHWVITTCTDPNALSAAEHLLAVGTK